MIELQWRRRRAQQTLLNKESAGLETLPLLSCFSLVRGYLSVLSFLGEELIPNPEMLLLTGFATSQQAQGVGTG